MEGITRPMCGWGVEELFSSHKDKPLKFHKKLTFGENKGKLL